MDGNISIEKPAIGAPCNGCGKCCMYAICPPGVQLVLKQDLDLAVMWPGPCPALTMVDNKYQCGLILDPLKYVRSLMPVAVIRENIATAVGSKHGCDFATNRDECIEVRALGQRVIGDAVRKEKILAAVKVIHLLVDEQRYLAARSAQ